jgi:hypothetical protein
MNSVKKVKNIAENSRYFCAFLMMTKAKRQLNTIYRVEENLYEETSYT